MQVQRVLLYYSILLTVICVVHIEPASAGEPVIASWRLEKPEVQEGPRNEAVIALDESWADYEEAVAKASEKLLNLFETAIAAATKKGDLGLVQSLTDAQKDFVEQGTLPTEKNFLAAVAGLKKQVATANTALMRSYTKTVTTLTKNGDVEQAKRLQAEQDSVFAGVAVAGGPRKAAAKPWVVDLTNEATLKKEWVLEGKWEMVIVPQGQLSVSKVKLGPGGSMATIAKFQGDIAMELTYVKDTSGNFGDLRIHVYGQEVVIGPDGKHQVKLVRQGNQLMYSVDGKPPTTLQIKQQDQVGASAIKFQFRGGVGASLSMGPIAILGRMADEQPQPAG